MKNKRGSALLLVLGVVIIISVAVLGLMKLAERRVEQASMQYREEEARHVAESAIAIALHPSIRSRDPALNQTLKDDWSFKTTFEYESGKLNINQLLAQQNRNLLLKLFGLWGLTLSEGNRIIDCMIDWVDADDFRQLQGAEQGDYPNHLDYPPNQPLQEVDEMKYVMSMDFLLNKKPDALKFFTVFGTGKLNVNYAPTILLTAACGISEDQAEAFVQQREKLFANLTNNQDVVYSNMESVRLAMGMTSEAFQAIEQQLDFDEQFIRIHIITKHMDFERDYTVIAQKTSLHSQIVMWLDH